MDPTIAQPPTLRFALMVDHLEQTANGKLILVGLFDNYFARFGKTPKGEARIVIAAGFFVAQIECSLAFGTTHNIEVRCQNADGVHVFTAPLPESDFIPSGEGMPLRGFVALKIGPLEFEEFGMYEWVVNVDGKDIGRCPFAIWEQADA